MSRGREDRSFQSVQKVHKKLPQIGCILRVQSGRRENLLTKWNYSLLKRAPKPSPPRGPNRPPAGSDILLFPRPCQAIAGRRTDYLLSPLWWSFHTGQRRLFSFFTALSVFLCPARAQEWPGPGFFCIHCRNCPPAVDRCAPLWYHNGRKNRIRQGKSLGKRRLSPAEGAKLSGGPIRAGTKDGCGSGEAHCEDRRCKAATPNLSGKRTE